MRRVVPGYTLVELLIVLAVIGIGVAVASLAFKQGAPRTESVMHTVDSARRAAIQHGQPVTVSLRMGSDSVEATAFPDGRVVADPRIPLRLLSGEHRDR